MKIGDTVTVKPGATEWLKNHGHWAEYITRDIDGMTGKIDADYRDLPGDKAHLCVELGFAHHVGISEHLLAIGEQSDADFEMWCEETREFCFQESLRTFVVSTDCEMGFCRGCAILFRNEPEMDGGLCLSCYVARKFHGSPVAVGPGEDWQMDVNEKENCIVMVQPTDQRDTK